MFSPSCSHLHPSWALHQALLFPPLRLCPKRLSLTERVGGAVRTPRAFAGVTGHGGSFAAETDAGNRLAIARLEDRVSARSSGPGCLAPACALRQKYGCRKGCESLTLWPGLGRGCPVKEAFPGGGFSVAPEKLNRWEGKALHCTPAESWPSV